MGGRGGNKRISENRSYAAIEVYRPTLTASINSFFQEKSGIPEFDRALKDGTAEIVYMSPDEYLEITGWGRQSLQEVIDNLGGGSWLSSIHEIWLLEISFHHLY